RELVLIADEAAIFRRDRHARMLLLEELDQLQRLLMPVVRTPPGEAQRRRALRPHSGGQRRAGGKDRRTKQHASAVRPPHLIDVGLLAHEQFPPLFVWRDVSSA